MADKAIIEKLENILNNLENQLGNFYLKQMLPKLICTLELYNRLCVDMITNIGGTYPPDFYCRINNGMTGVLHYFYSQQRKNLIYRKSDKVSESNKELCYDTMLDFSSTHECREYYLISDIEINGKRIIIKPFSSNTLEVFDFYRDQGHWFDNGLNSENESIFSSINSSRDDLFKALKDFYRLAIINSGINFDAIFGNIQYVSIVTAIFYLITIDTEHSNHLIDNDFICEHIKICDIQTIKSEMLQYINKYQKQLLKSAKEVSKNDIETIYNIISVNFDNYKIALAKGHIDKLFIQLNEKFCTFITKYSPTEYLTAFSYLNKLLCAYFPQEYNKQRDCRENIMFNKLAECISNEKLQICQGLKLRDSNRILTDIDAIIYDSKENTVYFVQFKYQDEFIRDIRAKRNQTEHLEQQVNKWFDAISKWLKNHSLDEFLKDSHFKDVKKHPKLKFIVFAQYNINQILVKKLKKDVIYVSDSMFYGIYSSTKNLKNLFKIIYKDNRRPIREPEHNNESCHIMDYEIYYDYNSEFLFEIENRWHKSTNENAIDITNFF